MTDAQKAAMEWLEHQTRPNLGGDAVAFLRTLKAMLAEPRLPEPINGDPDYEDALQAMRDNEKRINAWHAYSALYAHLTKPKTKTVEVWRVESSYHGHTRIWQANDGSKSNAVQMAVYLATDGHTCIRVTGPHTQEVLP